MYRDDIIERDMNWIRQVNPNCQSLEGWMKETNYTGHLSRDLLKDLSGETTVYVNTKKVNTL